MMIRMEGKFEVKEIQGKTKAKLFKDVQIGDVLILASDAVNGGRGYAGTVQITNRTQGGSVSKSQAELDNILLVGGIILAPAQQESAADVLSDLYDIVQDMRESGDTDLRTVLHHIDQLMRGTRL